MIRSLVREAVGPTGKRKLLAGIALCLLAVGCASTGNDPLTHYQRQAIEDIVVAEEAGRLNECQVAQIDLDRDWAPETVIVFKVGSYASQVRALKWEGEQPTILFENGSDTPNTAFCLTEGVPTISLERSQEPPAENTRLAYQWDGKAFIPGPGVRCPAEREEIAWQDCQVPDGTR